MHAGQRREEEKDQALDGSKGGAAEHLAEHDGRTRDGRSDDGEEEAFVAVLDERHHGEDRSEKHNHDDGAGEEVAEGMAAGSSVAGGEGAREAGAEGDPEEQRRGDNADDAGALAIEADDLTLPEREGRNPEAGLCRADRM